MRRIRNGDCTPRTLLVRAPWFTRFDVSLSKRFETGSRVNFELRFDVLNVFDNVNFNLANNPGSGATIFQVTEAYRDPEQLVRSRRPARSNRLASELVEESGPGPEAKAEGRRQERSKPGILGSAALLPALIRDPGLRVLHPTPVPFIPPTVWIQTPSFRFRARVP